MPIKKRLRPKTAKKARSSLQTVKPKKIDWILGKGLVKIKKGVTWGFSRKTDEKIWSPITETRVSRRREISFAGEPSKIIEEKYGQEPFGFDGKLKSRTTRIFKDDLGKAPAKMSTLKKAFMRVADRGEEIREGSFKGLNKLGEKYVMERKIPGTESLNGEQLKKFIWDKNGNLIFETKRKKTTNLFGNEKTITSDIKKYKERKLAMHTKSTTKTGKRTVTKTKIKKKRERE